MTQREKVDKGTFLKFSGVFYNISLLVYLNLVLKKVFTITCSKKSKDNPVRTTVLHSINGLS